MAFLVKMSARAEADFAGLFVRIDAENSPAALKWYIGLRDQILSLELHPERCPQAPDHKSLRHLLYGDKPDVYRVIFRIEASRKLVTVLTIRHGAMKKLTAAERKLLESSPN